MFPLQTIGLAVVSRNLRRYAVKINVDKNIYNMLNLSQSIFSSCLLWIGQHMYSIAGFLRHIIQTGPLTFLGFYGGLEW